MTTDADWQARESALLDCANTYGVVLSDSRLDNYLRLLGNVPARTLELALDAHARDPKCGRFFPQVADIFAKLPNENAHPGADSAWAIAMQSFDEEASVVWTKEIAAARNLALPIWEAGDKVGARMAFRDGYEKAMSNITSAPVWTLSPGHDLLLRQEAVQHAVNAGLITKREGSAMLPHHNAIAPEVHDAINSGLLEGRIRVREASEMKSNGMGAGTAKRLSGAVVDHPRKEEEGQRRFARIMNQAIKEADERDAERRAKLREQVIDEDRAMERRRNEMLMMLEQLKAKEG